MHTTFAKIMYMADRHEITREHAISHIGGKGFGWGHGRDYGHTPLVAQPLCSPGGHIREYFVSATLYKPYAAKPTAAANNDA